MIEFDVPGFGEWSQQFQAGPLANLSPHCGHIFTAGELMYRCQDCGLDDTCVVCMECWRPEDHVGHLYGYTISQGSGGSCDCGEAESWKKHLSCPKHPMGVKPDVEATGIRTLNFALVFEHLITKIIKHSSIEQDLQDNPDHELVLYNDERHSFDQVIEILTAATGCSQERAAELAKQVDQLGFAAIGLKGDVNAARLIRATGLTVKMLPSALIECNEQMNSALQTILDLLNECWPIRFSFGEVLLQPHFIKPLLLKDHAYWKRWRINFQAMLTSVTLISDDFKRAYAEAMIALFPELMKLYRSKDTREPHLSILNFNVQIFTVPSIAQLAVSEWNALSVIIQDHLLSQPVEPKGPIRNSHAFHLLNHLLGVEHSNLTFKQVKPWIDYLALYHGCDERARRVDQHVEYSSRTWVDFLSSQLTLHEITLKLTSQLPTDVRIQAINYAMVGINCHSDRNAISINVPLFDFIRNAYRPGLDIAIPAGLMQHLINMLYILADIRGGRWVRNGEEMRFMQSAFCHPHHGVSQLHALLGLIKLCLIRGEACEPLVVFPETDVALLIKMLHLMLAEPLLHPIDEAFIRQQLAIKLPVVRDESFDRVRLGTLSRDLVEHDGFDKILMEMCTVEKRHGHVTFKMHSPQAINPFHPAYSEDERERAQQHPLKSNYPLLISPLATVELQWLVAGLKLDKQLFADRALQALNERKDPSLTRAMLIAAHLGVKLPAYLRSCDWSTEVKELASSLIPMAEPVVSSPALDDAAARKAKRDAALAAIQAQQAQFIATHEDEMADITLDSPIEQETCILCHEPVEREDCDYGYLIVEGIMPLGKQLSRGKIERVEEKRIFGCFHCMHEDCLMDCENNLCPLCQCRFDSIDKPYVGDERFDYLRMTTLEDYIDYVPPESVEMRNLIEYLRKKPIEVPQAYSAMYNAVNLFRSNHPSVLQLYQEHVGCYPAEYKEQAANRWIRIAGVVLDITGQSALDWQTWLLEMTEEERRLHLKLPPASEVPAFENSGTMPLPFPLLPKPLPEHYDALYREYWQSNPCKHSTPHLLVLCLHCHQVFCFDSLRTLHEPCMSTINLFLALSANEVIIIQAAPDKSIITVPGPYRDRFGEAEIDGNDLILDQEAFDEMVRKWRTLEWISEMSRLQQQ